MFLVHWIVNWLLSALALWLVAQIIPGIQIRGFKTALLATVVIVLVDITIGPILRFIAFPITFLTLGLFRLVLNALLLKLASMFTPGFRIDGFLNALIGSLVLTILDIVLRRVAWATLKTCWRPPIPSSWPKCCAMPLPPAAPLSSPGIPPNAAW